MKNKGKAAGVEADYGEEESEYAGPGHSPDFDQENTLDDEEGRSFGGSVGQGTAQAMDYLDQQDEGENAV